jgi:Myo-inositol oxygenase
LSVDRRQLLGLGLGGSLSGAVGLGAGYYFHQPLWEASQRLQGKPAEEEGSAAFREFRAQADAITAAQRRQTRETVESLKAKYEGEVLGRFRVWDLIEKLGLCVDPTDTALQCTSQYMHVCQILAAMERDEVLDETMLLAALLHDLGKVALLAGEAPDHIVCFVEPVEHQQPGCGLDQVVFQFGHDEIAYSRFKDHLPEHIAWLLRYHSMVLRSAEPFMDARDRGYEEKYLSKFRTYDQGTKSPAFLPPHATLNRYRDVIEKWFPNPILF